MSSHRRLLPFFSILVIMTMLFSGLSLPEASAQGPDGIERQLNAQTGKVSFISAEGGQALPAADVLGASRPPQDPAMALAQRFGPEFGLQDPQGDLQQMTAKRGKNGRLTVRYQQHYQGIPVMGGELIVDTNNNGDLYSINGEVSPKLSLSTQPTIDLVTARRTALQAVAKWYEKSGRDFVASEPELWIYDESLLQPSSRPAELVWRMEVMPKDPSMAIRELVLVNAQRGSISLHFNQVDTAWTVSGSSGTAQDPDPTPSPLPTETSLPAETSVPSETPVPTGTPIPSETVIATETVEATATAVPTEEIIPSEVVSTATAVDELPALEAVTWYVATTGSDSNSCSAPATPCLTINAAITKAAANDIVMVASGTYTGTTGNVVVIGKAIILSGGWDSSFDAQDGASIIDGGGARNGILVNAAAGTSIVIDHFVVRNSTTGIADGGGIYLYSSTLTLKNSSVISNTAGKGAGIFIISNAVLNLENSTISGNTAGSSGAGMYVVSGTVTLNNSTIAYNNSGSLGGGITRENGTVSLQNSIVAKNSALTSGSNCFGSITSNGHNIIGNTSGCNVPSSAGDKFNIDPLINSSRTGTLPLHVLQAGSPAIDAGNDSTCLAADQRGLSRPQGSSCDIGAYEYSAAGLTVVSGSGQAAKVGSTFALPFTVYVRDSSMNPVAGVTVTYSAPATGASGVFADSGTRTTTAVTDSSGNAVSALFTANDQAGSYSVNATAGGFPEAAVFQVTNNIELFVATTGSDANSCLTALLPCATIDGAITKATPGDTILVGEGTYTSSADQVVFLNKNVTLSGGWDTTFTAQNGWSILDGQKMRTVIVVRDVTSATVERVVIQNGSGYFAGGIYNYSSTLVLNNSLVRNSTCWYEYGCGGGIGNEGKLTLNNSTVSGNTSTSYGGGIYNGGTLILNNSTISGNTAMNGGGIFSRHSTVTLNNSTVSGNMAAYGGGIYVDDNDTITIQNTLVAGNSATVSKPDCFGSIHSAGYNLLGNNSGCWFSATTGDLVGTASSPINPRLTSLQGNSPSTLTHALMLGSPAIDAGNPASPGSDSSACLAADQRGVSRPVGLKCDIGAFEYQGNGTIPAQVLVHSGTPQYLTVGRPASSVLRAVLIDEDGDTVAGKAVTFTAPASGPSAIFTSTGTRTTTVVTDANGIATTSAFKANTVRGSYVIIASVAGLTTRANFKMFNGAQNVKTYTARNGIALPGTLLCTQTKANCTNNVDPHADAAHSYAMGTYLLYATQHGRDSINNRGMAIISTVHFYSGYANAFWTGKQMVFGDRYGFPKADDVVAHELTHGVTQYESNLFYYYQSGAINESFSDLWGEYYDQTNGKGTDNSTVKWLMGENVSGLGAIRSMSNPPRFSDPDRMSSPYYYEGEMDNGGVHTNSGVNNKAVYLMVEGGSFNGNVVTPLGWTKTAAIYYEVNSKLLSSGADYSDLYYALQKACTNLIGQKGITTVDCAAVKVALDIVEMNGLPAGNYNTDAPLCAPGSLPKIVFADDLEKGTGKWTFQNGAYPRWQLDSPYGPYAQSGKHSLYADDYPGRVTNATARLAALTIPPKGYLHFAHAYGFETGYYRGAFRNFDGGVLEYSINGGTTWKDAGSLIDYNGYKGQLFTGSGNPLSGRRAFVGDSHGYISTRLNLASLAGKKVSFRWRMGLDEFAYDWGWWIDNVKVYTCIPSPGAFNKTAPSNGATDVALTTTLSWSSSPYATSYQYCYDTINDYQCNGTWSPVTTTSVGISSLGANTTYYWQVRASNQAGTVYADNQAWGSFTTTSTLP